jgi:thymidine kinase
MNMGRMGNRRAYGWIEVITGPMFSGKTAQLILRVTQAQAVGQKVQVFKPKLDTRSASREVRSHVGLSIDATPVREAKELLDLLDSDIEVVALDEGQFFDHAIVAVCNLLADQGKRVIVAGLDMDFRGEPFGPMSQLMAVAEVVDKFTALCTVCGEPASFSQRLINGEPARYSDPVILLGGSEIYQPRCRSHHLVPGKEILAMPAV